MGGGLKEGPWAAGGLPGGPGGPGGAMDSAGLLAALEAAIWAAW